MSQKHRHHRDQHLEPQDTRPLGCRWGGVAGGPGQMHGKIKGTFQQQVREHCWPALKSPLMALSGHCAELFEAHLLHNVCKSNEGTKLVSPQPKTNRCLNIFLPQVFGSRFSHLRVKPNIILMGGSRCAGDLHDRQHQNLTIAAKFQWLEKSPAWSPRSRSLSQDWVWLFDFVPSALNSRLWPGIKRTNAPPSQPRGAKQK